MVLAEAVIPGTLAAIAELQVGIIRIRAAADGAFVVVGCLLLLLLCLMHRLSIIHRSGRVAVLDLLPPIKQMRRCKERKVQQRQYRSYDSHSVAVYNGGNDLKGEECPVDDGQLLDLDGDNKKQQHGHIGKQHRKGQKH